MKSVRIVTASLACLGLASAPACAQETPSATPAAAPAGPTMEDVMAAPDQWREVEADNLLVYETTKGRIVIEMLPEVAPKHVEQFRAIAKSGDFDGTAFHRVLDTFMVQGGDIFALKGRESGLPNIPGEFTFRRNPGQMVIDPKGNPQEATQGYYKGFPLATQSAFLADMTADGMVDSWMLHCPGVVSTARTNDPNSANSQFFLMRYQADHLDKQYTAWGRVLEGFDVVRAIKIGPEPNGYPIEDPDVLNKAYMVTQMPEDERIKAYVQRTDTQAWSDRLAAAAQLKNHICDLPQVAAVIEG